MGTLIGAHVEALVNALERASLAVDTGAAPGGCIAPGTQIGDPALIRKSQIFQRNCRYCECGNPLAPCAGIAIESCAHVCKLIKGRILGILYSGIEDCDTMRMVSSDKLSRIEDDEHMRMVTACLSSEILN